MYMYIFIHTCIYMCIYKPTSVRYTMYLTTKLYSTTVSLGNSCTISERFVCVCICVRCMNACVCCIKYEGLGLWRLVEYPPISSLYLSIYQTKEASAPGMSSAFSICLSVCLCMWVNTRLSSCKGTCTLRPQLIILRLLSSKAYKGTCTLSLSSH